jgi:hypothetical protein
MTIAHTYRGEMIAPCQWRDSLTAGLRWYVVMRHHTGICLDETYCPRFNTLAAARRYIDGCLLLGRPAGLPRPAGGY